MKATTRYITIALGCMIAMSCYAQEKKTSVWQRIKQAAAAIQSPSTPSTAGTVGDSTAADLQALDDRFVGNFSRTRFPGIYQMQGDPEQAAVLMTRGAEIVMNIGSPGMHRGPNGPRLSEMEEEAVLRPLLPSLDTDRFIQFGGSGPLRMVVLSGIDCSYCAALESQLAAGGVRYAVIPSAIFAENLPFARNAYCATDPAKAWAKALQSGKKPASAPACDFDAEYFHVVAGLLGASTPRVLYADGDLSRPPRSNALPSVRARLAELAKDDVHF